MSINQPAYLGWMGYMDRIRRSDWHILLDTVQFEKGSYTNRCRIRQRDGREMWLTIPVEKGQRIAETRCVEYRRAQLKHQAALRQAYGEDAGELVPKGDFSTLRGPCWFSFRKLARALGVRYDHTQWASELNVRGRKSELVLNLCKEVGATTYLSGPQGRNYLDLPAFEKAGIEIVYHDFPTDGDWGLSAVHHLFTKRSIEWPQIPSLDSSQASAEGADPPRDPRDRLAAEGLTTR